ncbi:hypothetical protein I2485_05365 [Nesterenkonia sp. E16_7]|nr:hypothetical protein [Nesterenkonia sp. E16_7]MBO0598075.1 hypothetical protein [Nesterenkonia sp. E16_7]
MTSLVLLGCAEEKSPGTPTEPSATADTSAPETSEPPAPSETTQPETTEAPEGQDPGEGGDGAGSAEGRGGDLPDPDAVDLERTEELGAYFSEEEACMSVGSMLDGLQNDMNSGIEEDAVLDEIYSAVEQNYILVPDELREPMEDILDLLDTEVDSLDEEAVLVAAEPVDGWLTVGFCEGEYHNQTSDEDV